MTTSHTPSRDDESGGSDLSVSGLLHARLRKVLLDRPFDADDMTMLEFMASAARGFPDLVTVLRDVIAIEPGLPAPEMHTDLEWAAMRLQRELTAPFGATGYAWGPNEPTMEWLKAALHPVPRVVRALEALVAAGPPGGYTGEVHFEGDGEVTSVTTRSESQEERVPLGPNRKRAIHSRHGGTVEFEETPQVAPSWAVGSSDPRVVAEETLKALQDSGPGGERVASRMLVGGRRAGRTFEQLVERVGQLAEEVGEIDGVLTSVLTNQNEMTRLLAEADERYRRQHDINRGLDLELSRLKGMVANLSDRTRDSLVAEREARDAIMRHTHYRLVKVEDFAQAAHDAANLETNGVAWTAPAHEVTDWHDGRQEVPELKLDPEMVAQREEAVRRFAEGMELDPEVLGSTYLERARQRDRAPAELALLRAEVAKAADIARSEAVGAMDRRGPHDYGGVALWNLANHLLEEVLGRSDRAWESYEETVAALEQKVASLESQLEETLEQQG